MSPYFLAAARVLPHMSGLRACIGFSAIRLLTKRFFQHPKRHYEKQSDWGSNGEDSDEESLDGHGAPGEHGERAVDEHAPAWAEAAVPRPFDQAAEIFRSRQVRGVYEAADDPAAPFFHNDLSEMSDAAEEEPVEYPYPPSPPPSYIDAEANYEASTAEADEAPSDEPEANDLLLELWRDRRTLILDSVAPQHMPHIAITPPENTWDYYWAWAVNTVPPQSTDYLTVLTPDVSSLHAHSPTGLVSEQPCLPESKGASLLPSDPLRVFNPSAFARLIGSASQEREQLFLDNISAALYKHACKASALLACSRAPSARSRWDDHTFRVQFEKPFRWSDEATPLLSYFARCPAATIVDSATPCTVPHIVIEEPAPDSAAQWAQYANTTPTPQDCAFGQSLIVPASGVTLVNLAPCEDEAYVYSGGSAWQEACTADEADEEQTPESTWSESEAGSEGAPLTPDAFALDTIFEAVQWPAVPEHLEEYGFEAEEEYEKVTLDVHKPGRRWADEDEEDYENDENEDDDDDEGLPPLDEWYQTIIARVHLQAS